MELRRSEKINGPLRTPIAVEVPGEYRLTPLMNAYVLNQTLIKAPNQDIDKDILISQLVRIVSLLSKATDLSSLSQSQQDAINTTVALLESTPMFGDQILAENGAAFNRAISSQNKFANNYSSVTGNQTISNVYEGLENIGNTP